MDESFGLAVSISSNGDTLAVGAPGEASAAGAVHLFSRATGAWLPQTTIRAPKGDAYDLFGYAVTLSADGNTLVVGAYLEASAARGVNDTTVGVGQGDNSLRNSGAVYVFDRASNTDAFVFQDYVKALNRDADDRFGFAVALSDDGNTLAVGAYPEDSAARGVNDITVGQTKLVVRVSNPAALFSTAMIFLSNTVSLLSNATKLALTSAALAGVPAVNVLGMAASVTIGTKLHAKVTIVFMS